ncbi:cell division protein ZapA [Bacteroidales bacterium OttesenSCG-928-E04]|nr:cell division protein ZapA [Bacteroidales bacterium OttesenSCG-928-E04]
MSGETEKLGIEILQRRINVTVLKEHVFYYKEAEKKINESLLDFAKRWHYKDQQDLLSKVLLEFAVQLVYKNERLNEFNEELIPMMEELDNLADKLTQDK